MGSLLHFHSFSYHTFSSVNVTQFWDHYYIFNHPLHRLYKYFCFIHLTFLFSIFRYVYFLLISWLWDHIFFANFSSQIKFYLFPKFHLILYIILLFSRFVRLVLVVTCWVGCFSQASKQSVGHVVHRYPSESYTYRWLEVWAHFAPPLRTGLYPPGPTGLRDLGAYVSSFLLRSLILFRNFIFFSSFDYLTFISSILIKT